jgi:Leucine-rich repeat (LRR) protein
MTVSKIPSIPAQSTTLVQVEANYNNFEEFPCTLCEIIPLKQVDFSFNLIRQLPFEFGTV